MNIIQCPTCGSTVSPPRKRFCSWKCYQSQNSGKNHPRYKGGCIRPDGYRLISVNGKDYLEHRYVMEQQLGRALKATEIVHHKDGNKLNNTTANLELFNSQAEHVAEHFTRFRSSTHKQCCGCLLIKSRSEFFKYNRGGKTDPNYSRCKTCLGSPKPKKTKQITPCKYCQDILRPRKTKDTCERCYCREWARNKRNTIKG